MALKDLCLLVLMPLYSSLRLISMTNNILRKWWCMTSKDRSYKTLWFSLHFFNHSWLKSATISNVFLDTLLRIAFFGLKEWAVEYAIINMLPHLYLLKSSDSSFCSILKKINFNEHMLLSNPCFSLKLIVRAAYPARVTMFCDMSSLWKVYPYQSFDVI